MRGVDRCLHSNCFVGRESVIPTQCIIPSTMSISTRSPSWGSPAVRVEAAQGLPLLARHTSCTTPEVLQAIEHLSIDPVPAVRFQIASHLNVLYRTAPELHVADN